MAGFLPRGRLPMPCREERGARKTNRNLLNLPAEAGQRSNFSVLQGWIGIVFCDTKPPVSGAKTELYG